MPKYDRELIARMLETPAVFEDASRREQARLLREADNLEADARTVVREVPDGMVLVPREPTEAMLDVMHERIRILCDPAKRTADIQNDREVWTAMLSAASDHQQNAAQGGGEK